jgi:hypothetical protein
LIKEVTDRRSKRWAAVSNSKNIDREFYELITKDPDRSYTFMCVCNPLVDDDEEEEGEEEDDDEHSSVIDEWSEDEHGSDPEDKPEKKKKKLPKSGPCDGGKTCPCTKTSAELPDYPFTFTRAGIGRHHAASDMMDMRNPDAMGMYTFNDHMAYGALEVVQNMMLDFDEAYQGNRLLELWSVLEGIALFVAKGEGELMSMADDGARIQETVEQLARMMLTGLAALEAENKLKEIKNVGLVIAFFLQLGETWQEMSLLGESAPSKAKTFKFIPEKLDRYLHAIAKRHDIDIPGIDDLDNDDDDDDDEVMMPKAGKDPWGWTKAFASYCK